MVVLALLLPLDSSLTATALATDLDNSCVVLGTVGMEGLARSLIVGKPRTLAAPIPHRLRSVAFATTSVSSHRLCHLHLLQRCRRQPCSVHRVGHCKFLRYLTSSVCSVDRDGPRVLPWDWETETAEAVPPAEDAGRQLTANGLDSWGASPKLVGSICMGARCDGCQGTPCCCCCCA